MKIRAITVEDVPALLSMGQDEPAFKVDKEQGFWSETQLVNWIASGEDVLLCAEVEGRVVGFVLTALHKPTGKVTFENQFVLSEYRSQGIGTALVEEMIKQVKAKGASYINLLVNADNTHGLDYYETHGFERGEDCVWFGKFL